MPFALCVTPQAPSGWEGTGGSWGSPAPLPAWIRIGPVGSRTPCPTPFPGSSSVLPRQRGAARFGGAGGTLHDHPRPPERLCPRTLPVQRSSTSHREHPTPRLLALYPCVSLFWGDSSPSAPRILEAGSAWGGDPPSDPYSLERPLLHPTRGGDWGLISVLPCGTGGARCTQRALPPWKGSPWCTPTP